MKWHKPEIEPRARLKHRIRYSTQAPHALNSNRWPWITKSKVVVADKSAFCPA